MTGAHQETGRATSHVTPQTGRPRAGGAGGVRLGVGRGEGVFALSAERFIGERGDEEGAP